MLIKHTIVGRTRFKDPSVKKLSKYALYLETKFLELEGVKAVRFNFKCGSIVIEFAPHLQNNNQLLRLIEEILKNSAKVKDPITTNYDCCENKNNNNALAHRSQVRNYKRQFIALSVVAVGSFIKKNLLGGVLAQSLWSPMGIVGAIFAIPLLKKALIDVRTKKKLTLNSFLAGGIITALVFGEVTAAIEILWVHAGSEWLEAHVAESARNAIGDILKLSEKTVFIIQDGNEIEVPVENIQAGDTVIIHTDEKILVDGEVIMGGAMVNESPINGRSELIHRETGAMVYAGTLVTNGLIHVRAEKVGDQTYLSRIMYLVEDSLDNKANIELEADRLANRLVRLGIGATVITFMVTQSFYSAFSVLLVMSCPCATILAASSAVSAALSNAAKRGILIKGGRYLEEAGSQTNFCFDKTGTLTDKTLEITDIVPIEDNTVAEVLQAAYVAELHCRHPLGMAIKNRAEMSGIEYPHHTVCNMSLGKGVYADSDGSLFLVGNAKMMAEFEVQTDALSEMMNQLKSTGDTVMYVAKDKQILGLICASNRIKENAVECLNQLREEGVTHLVMLTGDEEATAANMASELKFDEYYASLLPEQKADIITLLQKDHKVAMVGDGINDVLALANADLGIAMGAMGSDVAIETADIALADDDLKKIIHLRKLSKETIRIIHQNYMLATGTNLIGVVMGLMQILNPMMAGIIHIVHTGGILFNSSRILNYEED